MTKRTSFLLLFFSLLFGGEVSTSISEEIVNEYFNIVGSHQIFAGKKESQSLWSIKNPRVKFKEGKAEFLATVLFEKDRINIKKDIKKDIEIVYDDKKNELQLLIKNALVKMERHGKVLGKVDLGLIYQTGLVFSGPKPAIESFKMKTRLGKIRFDILNGEQNIFYEEGSIRFTMNLDYKIL